MYNIHAALYNCLYYSRDKKLCEDEERGVQENSTTATVCENLYAFTYIVIITTITIIHDL